MMRWRVSSLLLLLGSGVLAISQADAPHPVAPKADLYGGFAVTAGGPVGTGRGYSAGGDIRLRGPLYLAIDGTGFWETASTRQGSSENISLFGPLFRRATGSHGMAVFGDLLAGMDFFRNKGQSYTWTYNDATLPALAADAGIDIPVSTHWAIRPEGGYLWTRFKNSTYGGPVSPANTIVNRGRFFVDMVYRY